VTLVVGLGSDDPSAAMRTVAGEGVFGLLGPLAALLLGTGAVLDEHERGTMPLLLARPVSRNAFLLGRLLAAAAACVAATVVVIAACYAALAVARGGELPSLARLLLAAGLSALAYVCLFTAAATLIARPVIAGIVFILIWEHGVAALPGTASLATIRFHAGNLAGILPERAAAAALLPSAQAPHAAVSAGVLLVVAMISAVAAVVVFARKESVS
jgi:ABC-type transport system involved in multi-copper enzyme maturation permease subunit